MGHSVVAWKKVRVLGQVLLLLITPLRLSIVGQVISVEIVQIVNGTVSRRR